MTRSVAKEVAKDGRYNELLNGGYFIVYKPTYIWGGPRKREDWDLCDLHACVSFFSTIIDIYIEKILILKIVKTYFKYVAFKWPKHQNN